MAACRAVARLILLQWQLESSFRVDLLIFGRGAIRSNWEGRACVPSHGQKLNGLRHLRVSISCRFLFGLT